MKKRYRARVCSTDVPGKNELENASRIDPIPSSSTLPSSWKSLTISIIFVR